MLSLGGLPVESVSEDPESTLNRTTRLWRGPLALRNQSSLCNLSQVAWGIVMCDQCKAIERQIFKYRQAHESIDDELAVRLLAEVIADLEAEKAALHPNEKPVE